ncbi:MULTISPECIES: 2'-5' RNA ligase family protein [unclassified Nocardioides]|uniref:2'-5' RNA ligase family protein n=1 Tax=unclassified Nocardioides TaxID=2615069 RepID=UPI0030142C00
MDTTNGVTVAEDGADHWQWRPDWADERTCAFWYVTVPDGAVRLPALDAYVDALGRSPWLDPVPPRWWHLTLTEIGYDDELGADLLAEVAATVRSRLAGRGPLELELGPVVRFRTAIALTAGPDETLRELQALVRRRTQEVLGEERPVVHPTRFRPHVSLAYLNRAVPAADLDRAVADASVVRATVPVDRLTLAVVTRRDRHYQWHVLDELKLGR